MLEASVKDQMIADVPVGAFLSGGIDSSLIVSLMQKNHGSSVKTFSIGFDNKQYDEAQFAKSVANHLGTDHSELYVSESDVIKLVPRLHEIYSEPLADSSQLPTVLVSALAREKVTVALTGDAGDELFAGYNRHAFVHNGWPKLRRVPLPLRKVLVGAVHSMEESSLERWGSKLPGTKNWTRIGEKLRKNADVIAAENYGHLYSLATTIGRPDILTECHNTHQESADYGPQKELLMEQLHSLEIADTELDPARVIMLRDQVDYLHNDVLAKVDRASMSVSLETRAPFLDHRLAEFTQTLPTDYFFQSGQQKILLKQLLSRHVPNELYDRPKMGFAIPVNKLLGGELRDWVEDLFSEQNINKVGLFDANSLSNQWNAHIRQKRNNIESLWPAIIMQSWCLNWQCDATNL